MLLESGEKIVFDLREIYEKFGYSRYKMSKFEEYDLYVRNKDFLVSDNVITFTDTDGRLMALKPDVTLSIVNNLDTSKTALYKVYYNENVYRVSKGTNSFKEIMQTGLECIGSIDDYCICEVISLAAKSLGAVSSEFVLDISHLGITESVIDSLEISKKSKQEILKYIEEKNVDGIGIVMANEGKNAEVIKKLVTTYGTSDKVFPFLDEIKSKSNADIIENFKKIVKSIENAGFKNKVNIDFSLISDMNYYNGYVFKGFISGIASAVLSGGQYDKLMKKLNKNCGAIGFAVYVDMLSRYSSSKKNDEISVILYDNSTDINALYKAVNTLGNMGENVFAAKEIPEDINYAKVYKMVGEEVKILE